METSMTRSFGRRIFGGIRLGIAIGGVLMAGAALAQGPGGGMGPGPGFAEHRPPFEQAFGAQGDHGRWWNNPTMVDKLKLTNDQRKAMDDTLLQHRETLIDLRASLQKAELGLEPLMKEDQPNESQILAQIDTVAQARAELEKANARFLLAIRSKLTPDQWKQLQTDRAGRAEQHRGWGNGGQGRGAWKPGGPGPGGQAAPQSATPPPPPQSKVDRGMGADGLDGSAAGGQL